MRTCSRQHLASWLTLSAIGLIAVACGSDPSDITGKLPAYVPPQFALGAPANGIGACLTEDTEDAGFINNVGDLNCTSNDVDISFATITEYCIGADPTCNGGADFIALPVGQNIECSPGEQINARTVAFIENSAQQRYDFGLWINPGPGKSAKTGTPPGSDQCSHFNLVVGDPDGEGGTVPSLDGAQGGTDDGCGDMLQGTLYQIPLDVITLTCPSGGATGITIDACAAWQNSTTGGNDRVCPIAGAPTARDGFAWGTTPGTTAKCRCEALVLPVLVRGRINIIKETAPNGASGSFSFTHNVGSESTPVVPSPFNLSDGQTQSFLAVTPGSYTVTEGALAGFELVASGDGHLTGCVDPTTNSSINITTGVATIDVAAGETVTCTFVNRKQAVLRIVKATEPDGDPTNFTFSPTGGWNGGSNFTRADNEAAFSSGFLTPGTYGATETVPSGWALTNRTCVNTVGGAAHAFSTPANGVSVDLAAGEDVTCTFTDTKQVVLRIVKVTDPDGDPTNFTFSPTGGWNSGSDFTRADNQAAFSSGFLTPGTYGATETVPGGWALANRTCVNTVGGAAHAFSTPANGVSVDLTAGEDVTCTFTDTKQSVLRIVKATEPDGDPTNFTFSPTGGWNSGSDFTRADNQAAFSSGFLAPGTYGATETVPSGWALTNRTCVNTSGGTAHAFSTPANGVSVDLAAGEDVTCTFTDTKQAVLRIVKATNPDGDPTDFTFSPTGGWNSGSTFTRADNQAAFSSGFLTPGTYGATETVPSGWALTSRTCVNTVGGAAHAFSTPANGVSVDLAAGDDVTCTFTDTKQAVLRIAKATDPDGDLTDFTFSPTGGWNSGSTFTRRDNQAAFSSGFLTPGTYGATETVPSGWDLTNRACVNTVGGAAHAFSTPSNGVSVTLGAGEDVTCTFTDTKRGTITIVKNTIGADATFGFTHNVGSASNPAVPSPFNILTVALTGSQAFTNVVPGTYIVEETTLPAFWQFTSLVCSAGGSGAAQTATIVLPPGGNITCTFTNTFNPPSVEGRMTGGGQQIVVNAVDQTLVMISRGFTIHCDIILSNNLEVNWKGNKWHIDKPLTSAQCFDDPTVSPEPPRAGFDTFVGQGTGALNGVDGSLILFTFVDYGEPGKNDLAAIRIWAPGGALVLDVALTNLDRGNIQAHEDQPHK